MTAPKTAGAWAVKTDKKSGKHGWRLEFKLRWQLYIMLLLPVTYVFIFGYMPLSGLLIAFQDYSTKRGIWGSKWIGFEQFEKFFSTPQFTQLLWNTFALSLYSFLAGFPFPIILALALNECPSARYKKLVQMVTYAPYFLSTVVMCGIVIQFLHIRTGIINKLIVALGGTATDFMGNANYFRSIYVWSGIWQGAGYSAVIYLAALSGIDPSLQEAAIIDGANRFQRVWHVDLPAILPTVIIQMILSLGSLLSVGYEKVFLLQNTMNLSTSEVISTFVYKRGLKDIQYSYSTAVGLFNSVVSLVLIATANFIARKVSDTSLW